MRLKFNSMLLIVMIFTITGNISASPIRFRQSVQKEKSTQKSLQQFPFTTKLSRATSSVKYLPTVVNRTSSGGGSNIKYDFKYDMYGNIEEFKVYMNYGNEQMEIVEHQKFEYAKLPDGSFVSTKRESLLGQPRRYTASYDAKGMMLFEKSEIYGSQEKWEIWDYVESVLTNGVRTGLRRYNTQTQEMENDTNFVFDSKGRIQKYTDEYCGIPEDESGEPQVKKDITTYVWEDNDKLIEQTLTGDDGVITISNIQYVLNCEYINAYDLFPENIFVGSDKPISGGYFPHEYFRSWKEELNPILYNARIDYNGASGNILCTTNTDNTYLTMDVKLNDKLIQHNELTLLKQNNVEQYVSVTHDYDMDGNNNYKTRKELSFNKYNDIVREFSKYEDFSEDSTENYSSEEETLYNRAYNSNAQPTHTVCSKAVSGYYGTSEMREIYTDTYTAWAALEITALNNVDDIKLNVYPNPVVNSLIIEDAAGMQLSVMNMQGNVMLNTKITQDVFTVDATAWTNGTYILKIGNSTFKVIKK